MGIRREEARQRSLCQVSPILNFLHSHDDSLQRCKFTPLVRPLSQLPSRRPVYDTIFPHANAIPPRKNPHSESPAAQLHASYPGIFGFPGISGALSLPLPLELSASHPAAIVCGFPPLSRDERFARNTEVHGSRAVAIQSADGEWLAHVRRRAEPREA